MKTILHSFSFLLLLLSVGLQAQRPDIPFKPGACYLQSQKPIINQFKTTQLAVYTGPNPEQTGYKTRTTKTKEATTKREKKKSSVNCKSENPDDCFVWSEVEVPAEFATFYIVEDTMKEKNYKFRDFVERASTQESGLIWEEVVCNSGMTKSFIKKVALALQENGYNTGVVMSEVTDAYKTALLDYQRMNELPIGGFNMKTMDKLGVFKKRRRRKKRRKRN